MKGDILCSVNACLNLSSPMQLALLGWNLLHPSSQVFNWGTCNWYTQSVKCQWNKWHDVISLMHGVLMGVQIPSAERHGGEERGFQDSIVKKVPLRPGALGRRCTNEMLARKILGVWTQSRSKRGEGNIFAKLLYSKNDASHQTYVVIIILIIIIYLFNSHQSPRIR